MTNRSRVKKSLKNAQVALIFYVANLFLQFFYRKIFLEHLGPEFLGLNTTAMNLLQFLNLAELGVGASVSYSLYKPLADNDRSQINEIVSVQGYLYNRIGIIVLGCAFILMLFFPWFFSDIKIPLVYLYATFGVLLISALSSYFLNYQEILLISDQKEYKLNYAIQSVKILKIIFQILFIYLFVNGYIWWLVWELIAAIATIIGVKYVISQEYPWLNTDVFLGKKLIAKYPQITLKTKQLFAHKIAGFALNQSSSLVIYAFTSFSFVAFYGNYLLVIAGVTAVLGAIFNSSNAGVGNLVSEGNKEKMIAVFDELFTIRFLLGCIACFGIYKLTPIFITYWVGSKYLLKDSTLILMVIIMYLNITRLTVDSFLNGFGLFNDIGAPILETVINIGLSIFLGYVYGINGVLIGVITSLLLIIFCWKPYFLFRKGFNHSLMFYVKKYLVLLIILGLSFFLTGNIMSLITIDPYFSISKFLIYSFLLISVFSLLLFFGLLLFTSGMKQFYRRCKSHLIK